MRTAVAFLFLLFPVIVSAQTDSKTQVGHFEGPGFTLTLPKDVTINVAPTSETAGGFAIDLANDGENQTSRRTYRYIALATRWDTDELGSLDAVVKHMIENPERLVPPDLVRGAELSISANLPAKLDTVPARRLVINFTNSEKKPSIRQLIVAYRPQKDASSIIYVMSLTTTRQAFEDDIEIFGKVLSGFKVRPE